MISPLNLKATNFGSTNMVVEHEIRLRVRYEETDTMQVVYYAKYFVWFESGRIELLRSIGLSYRDVEKRGLLLPVVEAKANYQAPAHFDDEILVKTRLANMGNTSVRFENEVFKLPEKTLLCTGYTVHVLVDREGKPTKIPEDFLKKFHVD